MPVFCFLVIFLFQVDLTYRSVRANSISTQGLRLFEVLWFASSCDRRNHRFIKWLTAFPNRKRDPQKLARHDHQRLRRCESSGLQCLVDRLEYLASGGRFRHQVGLPSQGRRSTFGQAPAALLLARVLCPGIQSARCRRPGHRHWYRPVDSMAMARMCRSSPQHLNHTSETSSSKTPADAFQRRSPAGASPGRQPQHQARSHRTPIPSSRLIATPRALPAPYPTRKATSSNPIPHSTRRTASRNRRPRR